MRRIVADWLWLLVFCIFALGYIFGGWSASKETPAQQQYRRAENAEAGPDDKLASITQSHSKEQAPKAEKKEEHSASDWITNFFELKLTDAIIAIFTVVLAIKTSGLFVETAGLRSDADKQSKDMEASIKAAEKAAASAQKSADVAEAALIDAERPFLISIEPWLKIYRYGPPGSIPVEPPEWVGIVDYGFVNVGRSVAFLKEVTAELALLRISPKRRSFLSGALEVSEPSLGHYPIGVDKTYECPTYGIRDKIDAATFALIRDDELKRFLFGYVRYTDIFGYLHTEEFCFRFTKIGGGANIKSDCTMVGSNSYNFVRRKKLPATGYETPTKKGSEATEYHLARINQTARCQD
ncbi:hypothetical protein [Bradyrhizobium sp.]|uniref:hypothetical protein n=1 Tax=Bradyrhizobium sp. TaxID=376 RepID=UPI002BCA38C6|nr:hypothetical protein [Bradyrhizobium sp.]HWX61356.1 hypothetical protein [Bradyrhizobium sp.]